MGEWFEEGGGGRGGRGEGRQVKAMITTWSRSHVTSSKKLRQGGASGTGYTGAGRGERESGEGGGGAEKPLAPPRLIGFPPTSR